MSEEILLVNIPSPLRPYRLPFLPALCALGLLWLSLTPSLLPRPALFQGLLCGVAALLGYAVGALLGWLIRSLGLSLTGTGRRVAWRGLGVLALVGTVVMLVLHLRWQRHLREALEMDQVTYGYVSITVVTTAVVFGLFLVISRLLRAAGRSSGRQVARILPARVAVVTGVLIVAVATYGVADSLLFGRTVERLDATFMAINDEFTTDVPAPTSPHLSAGPASGVEWADLGRQGRVFIANAPTAEAISAFTGAEALQPVRAYVGVGTDREIDLREEAALAVAELERTGGFERAVINVATGTGRGWINENQARALEYMWEGDTATVSMQYSYLPSWMSFVVDGQRAQDAGRLLFEAVHDRWSQVPEDDRPLLVVSGESLGSFGGEAAFSGAQDFAERTDGALFVGPTATNRLWSQFTRERDTGTSEVAPLYRDGAVVRFSEDGRTWPGAPVWDGPRVGYLQHANDPVTWWSTELALHRPDWLTEERGRDVLPQTRWIPIVTMLQVAADQIVANDVPDGQGHEFGQAPVHAWGHILPPPGWSDADSDRLAQEIKDQQVQQIG